MNNTYIDSITNYEFDLITIEANYRPVIGAVHFDVFLTSVDVDPAVIVSGVTSKLAEAAVSCPAKLPEGLALAARYAARYFLSQFANEVA